ncbi:MAG: flavodoxin family protein [Eubacterium sp.]|nr:flavodoxin family protein [Eubacterium sp.]
MKIVVLEGSPNKHGSSNLLAEEFIRGAKESGNEITVIDAAHADIHPCKGCIHCGYEGPCVQNDDMKYIRRQILEADMLVFVTPLYYYGMSAQLKTLIDRFCAFNSSIQRKHMKSALISAAWNSDGWTFDALKAHYTTLVKYLNLHDEGMIFGAGCGTPSMTASSGFPQKAYELGRRLRK